jgi:hypothetical protein
MKPKRRPGGAENFEEGMNPTQIEVFEWLVVGDV